MRLYNTIIIILIFSLGIVTHGLITQLFYFDAAEFSVGLRGLDAPEQLSSADHIREEDIGVYSNRVVLDIEGATWASITDTNSMDPILDADAHGIEIKPKKESDISVGDIVSYKSQITGGYIIHRVIEINEDNQGTYFILKGDNNPTSDPERVRFSQVHGILVAVIY